MSDPAPGTLVLASGNRGKLSELCGMLEPLGYALKPQSDWAVPEAVEDADTFVENALIKARNATLHTGFPAVADDSGLVVPALDGAPGVHSARYAGAQGGDGANNRKLLEAMASLEGPQRSAWFFCAMVMLRSINDPAPLVACASWQGEIAHSPSGTGGFGYDPLFWLPALACSSADLPTDEKNLISHRGQAARKLVSELTILHGG